MTEFAERPSTGHAVGMPNHDERFSRWRSGPHTFGPRGRILTTAAVILFGLFGISGGPNPFTLWFLMGYTVFASLVLKHTWQRVPIPLSEAPGRTSELRVRHPLLFRRLDGRILRGTAGFALGAVAVASMTSLSLVEVYACAVVAILFAVGLFLAWLSGV